MKKIIIAGGTGFLGNILSEYFKSKIATIIILTRGKNRDQNNIKYVQWDAKTLDSWKRELNNADVLINMTGKSVDCRYNQKNKDLILFSRTDATSILGKAIQECQLPPKVWLNSSTATIYRHSLDKEMGETDGEIGTGFSVNVASQWEKAFFDAPTLRTRKVALRTSIVLGKKGGVLPTILKMTKMGFGGKQGKGNQKISWIHELDFCRSLEFIINNTKIEGVVNIVSPTPVTNKLFMKTLRKITKTPVSIPTPTSVLELSARIIGTETELVLKSRNVIPKKLQDHGFEHFYSILEKALQNLTQ